MKNTKKKEKSFVISKKQIKLLKDLGIPRYVPINFFESVVGQKI